MMLFSHPKTQVTHQQTVRALLDRFSAASLALGLSPRPIDDTDVAYIVNREKREMSQVVGVVVIFSNMFLEKADHQWVKNS